MKPKQSTLSMMGFDRFAKTTRRAAFLAQAAGVWPAGLRNVVLNYALRQARLIGAQVCSDTGQTPTCKNLPAGSLHLLPRFAPLTRPAARSAEHGLGTRTTEHGGRARMTA